MSHVKVYTGSPVLAKAAAARLEDANIPYIEKDVTPGNAMTGDLGGGTFEILVEETDKIRAQAVLEGV